MAGWRTLSEMDASFARSRRRAAARRGSSSRRSPASRRAVRTLALGAGVFVLAGTIVAEAETPAAKQAKPRTHAKAIRCPIPTEFRRAFVRAADESRLPLGLLVALAYAESGMNPDAVSHEGAQGLLQLMPATARELAADPTDPDENVRAGARYLRRMLDRFDGDVDLALAAYNAGPSAVERADGPPASETATYVAKVRAGADLLVGCA